MHRIRYQADADSGHDPDRSPDGSAGRRPGPGSRALPWQTGGADPSYRQQLGESTPLDRRSRRHGGQVERSGGERRLPAAIQPGDRAGPVHGRTAGSPKLLGVDPLGRGRAGPRTCFASIPWAQDLRALATSVQVFARAEKGETTSRSPT